MGFTIKCKRYLGVLKHQEKVHNKQHYMGRTMESIGSTAAKTDFADH